MYFQGSYSTASLVFVVYYWYKNNIYLSFLEGDSLSTASRQPSPSVNLRLFLQILEKPRWKRFFKAACSSFTVSSLSFLLLSLHIALSQYFSKFLGERLAPSEMKIPQKSHRTNNLPRSSVCASQTPSAIWVFHYWHESLTSFFCIQETESINE